MSLLPAELLVANFAAREGRLQLPPPRGGVHCLPVDDEDWIGVVADDRGGDLIIFGHPDPAGGAGAHRREQDDIEVGSDDDAQWLLRFDTAVGRHTLWTRLDHADVGHAEFERVVLNMRRRFKVWKCILQEADAADAVDIQRDGDDR